MFWYLMKRKQKSVLSAMLNANNVPDYESNFVLFPFSYDMLDIVVE